MERTVLSLNLPNILGITVILLGWLVIYAIAAQIGMRAGVIGGSADDASTAGGY